MPLLKLVPSSPPVPGGTPLVPIPPVAAPAATLPVPAARAAVAALPVPVLLVSLWVGKGKGELRDTLPSPPTHCWPCPSPRKATPKGKGFNRHGS